MNLFTLPANDQSIYYLGQLFGNVGTVLNTQTGSMLLGTMFHTLNTSALILGAFMVVHALIMGLLKTATEGEFLGRQWSSLWVPLRLVMGIASLFPTPAGYSLLQVCIMWFIIQGVGAADALWTTAINVVYLAGSPYASISLPNTPDNTSNMKALFKALTCETSAVGQEITPVPPSATGSGTTTQKYYYDMYTDSGGNQHFYYYCPDNIANSNSQSVDSFCTSTTPQLVLPKAIPSIPANQIQNTPIPGSNCVILPGSGNTPALVQCPIGPSGQCGSIQYADYQAACDLAAQSPTSLQSNGAASCSTNSFGSQSQQAVNCLPAALQCAAFQAQTAALNNVISALETTANQLVSADHDYIAFTKNVSPNPPLVYAPMFPKDLVPTTVVANWPVPSWLNNYCQNNNQGVVQPCCVYANVNTPPPNPAPVPAPTCQQWGTSQFPYPYATSGTNPWMNTSSGAASIYWNYNLQQQITGAQGNSSSQGTVGSANFIQTAVNYYLGQINAGIVSAMATSVPQAPAGSWQNDAENYGWIMAGAYYYQIASTNNQNTMSVIPPLTVTVLDPTPGAGNSNNPMAAYRTNIDTADAILGLISQPQGAAPSASPQFAQISGDFGSASLAGPIVSSFMTTLTGAGSNGQTTNPLVAMQNMGEEMLIAGQVIYVVFIVVMVVLLVVADIDPMALGTGVTEDPAEAGLAFTAYTFWALIMFVVGWLIFFGGVLAVYTPLIPYIIFVFSAIGWFIATIEAMVAAPFIALGILSPHGEHEIMGRAAPAGMILLNIFLRPSLIIMGMMIAMLLAPIVISMINAGFLGVMSSILPNPMLAEIIFFLSAYCMLVVTALNKVFALIHLLPSRVLMWLGHHPMTYGEEEGLMAVKSGMDATIGGAKSASEGSFKAVQQAGKEKQEAIRKKKEKGGPGVK